MARPSRALTRARRGSALALLAQVLPPVGIVFDIHLLWIGADHSGGKFQAAVVLAAIWVLGLLAVLRKPPRVGRQPRRSAVVVGFTVGASIFSLLARFGGDTGLFGAIVAWIIAGRGILMLA